MRWQSHRRRHLQFSVRLHGANGIATPAGRRLGYYFLKSSMRSRWGPGPTQPGESFEMATPRAGCAGLGSHCHVLQFSWHRGAAPWDTEGPRLCDYCTARGRSHLRRTCGADVCPRLDRSRARVDGLREKRSFDIGSEVKQRDVLYELDWQPYEAAVERRETTSNRARRMWNSPDGKSGRAEHFSG